MLKGKTVLITGATGGLGVGVTKVFLSNNAKVAATYRSNPENIENVEWIKADVTSEASVINMVKEATEKLGKIDVIVNLVGSFAAGKTHETDEKTWDQQMTINLKSVFLCCKHALIQMQKQGHGKILNISSRPAVEKQFRKGLAAYSVSKAGVSVLTETIAVEYPEINSNAVLPSVIDTPDTRKAMPDADYSKWVKPEDIGEVLVFLASDKSNVVSGASVPVYGKA